MRTKRFLAFLLVLLMVVSLFPAAALAEGPDDEPLVEDVPPAEEAPEGVDDLVEPEEDELPLIPAGYGIWLGETEITTANEDDVLGNGSVSFDATTNTLTFNVQKPTINGLHNGAIIDAPEVSELTIG